MLDIKIQQDGEEVNTRLCSEYGVEHPRWMTYKVKDYQIQVAFDEVYSKDFAILNFQKPDSVMLAEGSKIIVRSMRKIL